MRYINNLTELDLEIKSADERFVVSSDEGIRALSEFAYVVNDIFPEDPYSKEYQDAQMKLYLEISGKTQYTVENERTYFDFEAFKNNPYPYYTKSPNIVGDHLIAQGFLIKSMNLEPTSRILEFGPGWGNTTLNFAQMGYEVTAVDVEEYFLELIKYRTQLSLLSNKVNLVQKDMLDFSSDEKYDAAVFFECFHHCADHLKLIKKLDSLISDGGLIAFAAEPIIDFPYPWKLRSDGTSLPWGLRLDGISVWSIRKMGWLELFFDTSYFLRTLLLLGWIPKRYRSDINHLTDVIIARRSNMYYEPSEITLPPDECKTWVPVDPNSKLRFTSAKSTMSCAMNINTRFVEFCIGNYAPFDLNITLKVGSLRNNFWLPKCSDKGIYKMPIQNWDGKITITSQTWQPAKVLHNGDTRHLGVAVHYFRFVD